MKKLVYLFVASALVLACSKEMAQPTPEATSEPKTEQNKVSFNVNVEQTKADVSASGFAWGETDEAAVFSSNGQKILLTPSKIDGASAVFTGTLQEGDAIEAGALVVYPASLLSAEGAVTFGSTYTNGKGVNGPSLVAKVEGSTLNFKYLTGTIKFTISDVPSLATAIVVNTRTAADDAAFVCTGTYTIDFSGETPVLTGATATGADITISGLSAGANTIAVPIAQGEQKVYVSVKMNETTLFTKNVSLTGANAVSRNFYASMPALTINPEVYIIGDRIGWDANENTKVATTAFVGTRNDFVVTNKRYFRADVKYGEVTLKYGQEVQTNGLDGGTFILSEAASYIPYSGVYNISFNYVTAEFSVTPTSQVPAYMIGVDGDWSFNNNAPMTAIPNTNMVYRKGGSTNDAYKVYEFGVSDWGSFSKYIYGSQMENWWMGDVKINSDPEYPGQNCGGGAGVVLFDFQHNRFQYYGLVTEASSVELRGDFMEGGWDDGLQFQKVEEGSSIWTLTISLDADAAVKFVKNGTEWLSNVKNLFNTQTYNELKDWGNMTLPAGTYTIVFIDQNNSYYLFVNE